ncbi:hypothetical protein EV421DRAFT_1075529 [Armillaria borealis]|uniref:Heterokaryon incompatibility domain-containing protein n=1 Tax=Armillaria borealis TaxID=47425 RepID=A0AA39J6X0_9AGAR|nr:hypothetical protein EV421DRAFT_1075529 [Armillaria borealis]
MASPAKVQKELLHWLSLQDGISKSDQEKIAEDAHRQYQSLPEVIISAIDETSSADLHVQVPEQRIYTGRKPVITSSLADTPCASLGADGLLEKLNTTLGTSYTLDSPSFPSRLAQKLCSALRIPHTSSLSLILRSCISSNYDFGTAYARLRSRWYNDMTRIEDTWRSHEARDNEIRRVVQVNTRITNSFVPPRRLWDLYSNRVVPWWVVYEWHWSVSHAWMDEKDRVSVWSPINGRAWPVPLPKDVDLNILRIELLNLGAEYVWLDVLCLRQAGGPSEDLRAKEWELDVPTIGNVYRMSRQVVCYFSGLGRPLSSDIDLRGDRSWFRRAWTLQEMKEDYIIGGKTGEERSEEEYKQIMLQQLSVLKTVTGTGNKSMLDVLVHMQKRVSTNAVDRIAGMAYLVSANRVPAYYEKRTEEDAWTALVDELHAQLRAEMFFLCPKPGDGNAKWRPSWRQAMDEALPSMDNSEDELREWVPWDNTYTGYCIEKCEVRGLATGGQHLREGELAIEGVSRTFKIVANHQYPIPEEGSYTLMGSETPNMMFWVVGRRREGKFEKVSVFQVPDAEERVALERSGFVKEKVEVDLW